MPTEQVERLWQRLGRVQQLRFQARSALGGAGWNGRGRGLVAVQRAAADTLVFTESGTWKGAGGRAFQFSNVYRWRLDRAGGALNLEHLRLGLEQPVFLVRLVPGDRGGLVSEVPHPCGADRYAAVLRPVWRGVELRWHISGPAKDEDIRYTYR
ncbi:MAG: hypothetical protein GKR89_31195 [Candidatus Latescibacteria bacterium]|nr:hypothetical protein [Candidatus Latescibacterota bacterium]